MSMEKKGPSSWDVFFAGFWRDNPVFVMLLGTCPTLAVTNSVINCFAMGVSTLFVLVMSGILISMLRNFIPKQVRIASFIVVIATFVTIVDYLIQSISLDLYDSLGAFIQLIVVNCIILGRAEAFASRNGVMRSVLDAIGMGIGFTIALLCLGVVREVLGNGTLLMNTPYEISLFGPRFEPWSVMILPPGGFFVLGVELLFFNWWRKRKEARALAQAKA
ncbi:MAG TPA: electron transport complex subunit E [Candidatus Hydrogenedentes bacterium]|nr:MAG: Electron transport complex protein RnfE [Candidatus Hydrogenedentes bacterium ADurb.Bin170]HNZ48882.1 electron transport complex subunit E [Candidatus Hydrogenedentota bacterium]HOD94759.1 electron transport complex subunit E [Candidatus Hydrogenedentota bacterium]HOH42061.1 electron transport complex subunit E [Candidatus Hydrogenedentota bacterium]HOR50219.1 electron transport complex subunit E [Candidatus Hydrogenedentota bacterium]